jgi:uncharacterized protein
MPSSRKSIDDEEWKGRRMLSDDSSEVGSKQTPILDRLTLVISNVCNLACSYCYASHGTYYSKRGIVMTRETALRSLNFAARSYSGIRHINFFGGEPTLNLGVIEVVCEYARYLYSQGAIPRVPTFGITTNSYALDERTFDVLTGYGFNVTASIDGPKEIHDLKRRTQSGKGSYERVARNIETLLKQGLNVEFECTYTADHVRYGYPITALMDFFYDVFGCRTLHCPIVSAHPGSLDFISYDLALRLLGDAIEYSVENLARRIPKAISTAVRMLNSLDTNTPIELYCPAGRSEISINADGEIYACFMLMKSKEYGYGNVDNTGVGSQQHRSPQNLRQGDGRRNPVDVLIGSSDKRKNMTCKSCWAQPLCHGCLGEDLDRHRGPVVRSVVPGESAFCDYKRGLVDRFLHATDRAITR